MGPTMRRARGLVCAWGGALFMHSFVVEIVMEKMSPTLSPSALSQLSGYCSDPTRKNPLHKSGMFETDALHDSPTRGALLS